MALLLPGGPDSRRRWWWSQPGLLRLVLLALVVAMASSEAGGGGGGGRRLVEVYHPFPFTPEGLIRQLQHAQQAVQRGSLSLALVAKDGVVLAGERRQRSPLAVGPSPKIGLLDQHVGYVMSGIVPDGRYLIKRARLLSQCHWFEYGEEIGLPALLAELSKVVTSAHYRAPSTAASEGGKRKDLLDEMRSPAGPLVDPLADAEAEARKEGLPARHFGVGFLLAGPEHGYASPGCSLHPSVQQQQQQQPPPAAGAPAPGGGVTTPPPAWVIYEMGPSGMYLRWDARAIGDGSEKAERLLERLYRKDLSLDEAKRLAVQVCDSVLLAGDSHEASGKDGDEDDGGRPALEMAVMTRDAAGRPSVARLKEEEIRRLRAHVLETMGLVDPSSLD